ncbi:MAG: hypothetical protein FWD38_06985, partial [Oscillospiraceae bacterium]|nr:hypothetical protein [Oscillospiraceae bacterium]
MKDKQRTEIELLQKRSDYNDKVFEHAIEQIAGIDKVLPKLVWNDHDDDDYTKICRILCDYFKVEMKAPAKNPSEDQNNPENDALYLSGFRQKEVVLGRNWWKSNNGVMIGYLEDGTPLALTPCVIYGYKVYNPKTMQYSRVNKRFASSIQADAIAIFHVFPSESLKAADIVGFTLRENVYRDVIIILVCSFLANIVGIIPPIIAERIFDFVIPGRLTGALYVFIFVLLFFGIADAAISVVINLGVSRIHTRDGLALQV